MPPPKLEDILFGVIQCSQIVYASTTLSPSEVTKLLSSKLKFLHEDIFSLCEGKGDARWLMEFGKVWFHFEHHAFILPSLRVLRTFEDRRYTKACSFYVEIYCRQQCDGQAGKVILSRVIDWQSGEYICHSLHERFSMNFTVKIFRKACPVN